jgi:hypothetical protein
VLACARLRKSYKFADAYEAMVNDLREKERLEVKERVLAKGGLRNAKITRAG